MSKNKLSFLMVTRLFPPKADANGNILSKLAVSLVNKGCYVKVLACTDNIKEQGMHNWKNIVVEYIYFAESKPLKQLLRNFIKEPIEALNVLTKKILYRLCGTYSRIHPKYSKLSLNCKAVTFYKYIIKKSIQEQEKEFDACFDACVVTLMPHDIVWAAFDLKINIPIIVYQLDTYWNNNLLPQKYEEFRFDFEKKFSQESLFVMTTPQIFEINTTKEDSLSEKLISSEFPLIVPQESREEEISNYDSSDRLIHCVFAGTLYPIIRPPEKVISIIAATDTTNLCFDFYGLGQYLLQKSKDFFNAKNKIILHGAVSMREANEAQIKADVLMNIDNTNLIQVPSKIFDYISIGKPILNFYFYDESPTLRYLSKYPLCLNLNINTITPKQAADMINEFLNTKVLDRISFNRIEELFCENTPDYVAEQFLSAYKKQTRSKN